MDDAAEILRLQRFAYRSEAELYGDFRIQPLVQELGDLHEELSKVKVLKALASGAIIGSVRAYENDGTCHIGKLIVHPEFRKRGIGSALMREIEGRFPDAGRFELFTGHRSETNIRLYTGMSYRIFKTLAVNERLTLFYFEKRVASDGASFRDPPAAGK
ncbi:MAG: GNAT family N-acetyltransferase [Spirochaetes bacterium]|nr:GNAT family N-acetyltransferase [Spirochaetota bacterium]